MKTLLLILLAFLPITETSAQVPTLVEDILVGSQGSDPSNLVVYNGKLHFFASDPTHGTELWVRNSPNSNSSMVADTYTGSYSGASIYNWSNEGPVIFNGKLYYSGSLNANNFDRIMVYDGINTPIVAPNTASYPGTGFSSPVVIGNKMYFFAMISGSDNLFSYDGATAPVIVVANIGLHSRPVGNLVHMVAYKGKVYFAADSSGLGTELFAYDPAINKKVLVADISAGPTSSVPAQFMVANNKLYFTAVDTLYQLYSYDGTTLKRLTTPVTGGFYHATDHSGMGNIAMYRGAIFLEGTTATANHYALYKYDTATKVTSLVKDIDPVGDAAIGSLYNFGNNLYFNGTTQASGYELWKYNGATCNMVADLNPGHAYGVGWSNFATWQGGLYFEGNNGITGNELYKILDSPNSNSVVQQANWDGAVSIYPNPVSTYATLDIVLQQASNINIMVTNATGKQVYNSGLRQYHDGKNTHKIPLTEQAAGNYFYKLTSPNGSILAAGSFIKE